MVTNSEIDSASMENELLKQLARKRLLELIITTGHNTATLR